MLELQCAQRFPARPADPDSSVFSEIFPALQPEPSQPKVPTEKAKQLHLNWSPLGFMSEFARTSWRLFSHRMFDRLFSAGVSERPSPRCLPTLAVARFAPATCVSILWVIMFSLASSTKWLFFQNATQVQLHSGKNPIVLYQEMKLQFKLHVSIEPAAASLQQFN